jgi:hypothetical protein
MSNLEDESRKKLTNSVVTKMNTIMIGSLSIIEEELINSSNDIELQNAYEIIRKKILDLGNSQIKRVKDDISKYKIESSLYTIKLGIKRTEGN